MSSVFAKVLVREKVLLQESFSSVNDFFRTKLYPEPQSEITTKIGQNLRGRRTSICNHWAEEVNLCELF